VVVVVVVVRWRCRVDVASAVMSVIIDVSENVLIVALRIMRVQHSSCAGTDSIMRVQHSSCAGTDSARNNKACTRTGSAMLDAVSAPLDATALLAPSKSTAMSRAGSALPARSLASWIASRPSRIFLAFLL
jgi:hypothetical protein